MKLRRWSQRFSRCWGRRRRERAVRRSRTRDNLWAHAVGSLNAPIQSEAVFRFPSQNLTLAFWLAVINESKPVFGSNCNMSVDEVFFLEVSLAISETIRSKFPEIDNLKPQQRDAILQYILRNWCVRGASYWFGKISNFLSDSRCLCTFVLSWIQLPCKSYITSDLSVAIPYIEVPIWNIRGLFVGRYKSGRGVTWHRFARTCEWLSVCSAIDFFISIFEVSEVYLKSFYVVPSNCHHALTCTVKNPMYWIHSGNSSNYQATEQSGI